MLAETKMIDGVETRIVEDREEKNGKQVELTRDYYAIDVVHGAKFGLMMPGKPTAGQRFYQELALNVGMDRAEIVSVDEKIGTPADHKLYAPGVGPVKDGNLLLVSYRRP